MNVPKSLNAWLLLIPVYKISNSIRCICGYCGYCVWFCKNRPYIPTANNSALRLPNQDEWVPILRLTKSILDHWTVDNLAGAIGVAFVQYVRNGFFFCQVGLAKSRNLIRKKIHSSKLKYHDIFSNWKLIWWTENRNSLVMIRQSQLGLIFHKLICNTHKIYIENSMNQIWFPIFFQTDSHYLYYYIRLLDPCSPTIFQVIQTSRHLDIDHVVIQLTTIHIIITQGANCITTSLLFRYAFHCH